MTFKVGDRVLFIYNDAKFLNRVGVVVSIIEEDFPGHVPQLRVHFHGDKHVTDGLFHWKFRHLTPLDEAML